MAKKLALLLPAHNEELLIQRTVKSAINAGLKREQIYIVDDASEDETLLKVGKVLPVSNILSVEHSGKAGAVKRAIEYFELEDQYEWLHVADADSLFDKYYFRIFDHKLSKKYVATIGFVQSLKGNWLCSYRAISYTYGQHIIRRIQAVLGMITVLPGPVTCYRTDIIKYLDFETGSLTEDFDITLQIHRKRLGKIRFIPEAVNYTQDPKTVKDYANQSLRWYRGFFQGLREYKIGLRPRKIDLAVHLVLGELLLSLFQITVALYILIFAREFVSLLIQFILLDFALVVFFVVFTAVTTQRPRILLGVFYYHTVKIFELSLYLKSFFEVIILRRYTQKTVGWKVKGRRYEVSEEALTEIA